MSTISVRDLQVDLANVLRRLEAGESLVLVQDDRPLAQVSPILSPSQELRPYGLCKGEFKVPWGFDEPLPDELLADFEGR